MYTYESSLVKQRGLSGRWLDIDLKDRPIADLYQDYQEVYLILSNPALSNNVSLNICDIGDLLGSYDSGMTVSEWLTVIDDMSLPTSEHIPQANVETVFYNDLYQAGYHMDIVHRTAPIDSEIPDDEKTDICLTRTDTDYQDFYNHCLVTVNGLIHRVDHGQDAAYVRNGAQSARIANEHHLGAISFKRIGKLNCFTIRPEDIYARPDTPLYNVAMIKLPEDIGNRVPLLVLGGYLHILDNSYTITGDRTIKVSLQRTPYVDRFYASRKLMSLKPLEDLCNRDSRNPDHFVYGDLIKDEVIKAYLTLDNSFIILVETDNLFVEQHKLEYPHLPGRYYAYQRPYWPLMTELGRLPAYVADQESTGTWVISVYDNLFEVMRYRQHEYESEYSLDGARESSAPYYYAPGFLLEIGSDVKT